MNSYVRGMKTAALWDLFFSHFGALDSAFFLAMFRCMRYQFKILYYNIRPYLQVLVHPYNEIAGRNSNRWCLKVEKNICIALWVAGGATSMDATWGFGCHRTLVKWVFLTVSTCSIKIFYRADLLPYIAIRISEDCRWFCGENNPEQCSNLLPCVWQGCRWVCRLYQAGKPERI
jgi:hypothetical protein